MNKMESINELKNIGWNGFDRTKVEFPLIMSNNKMIFKWNSRISGIYAWINKINGKMYIGKGNNLYRRVYDEKRSFKNGRHENLKKLFNAVNKYGIDNFYVVQLISCKKDDLLKIEPFFISYFDTKNNGYNCTYGGEGCSGHIVTKEQIQKQKKKMEEYWTEERKKEHTEKMRKWANDPIRKSHLISVGKSWVNNPMLVSKHRKACKKSLSIERIEKQRRSMNDYYKSNGGKRIIYKQIILLSPNNEHIIVNKVSDFCKSNHIGKGGFYRFLKRKSDDNVFFGWKLISATT